jgi:hypothetical protein
MQHKEDLPFAGLVEREEGEVALENGQSAPLFDKKEKPEPRY